MKKTWRRTLRRTLPKPVSFAYRLARRSENLLAPLAFLHTGPPDLTLRQRLEFVRRCWRVSYHVDCAHTEEEILTFAQAVLRLPPSVHGCIVEAGCFRGGGTAKLSWLAKQTGRRLKVFDSFRGIPHNQEQHGQTIYGQQVSFLARSYSGSLAAVKANVTAYGCVDVCDFVEGWFEDTLPLLDEPIAAAYLDVDLAASTRTCLRNLYPKLSGGGVLMSQDGHLPLVLEVFADERFWLEEVRAPKPNVEGFGRDKLIRVRKPVGTASDRVPTSAGAAQ